MEKRINIMLYETGGVRLKNLLKLSAFSDTERIWPSTDYREFTATE